MKFIGDQNRDKSDLKGTYKNGNFNRDGFYKNGRGRGRYGNVNVDRGNSYSNGNGRFQFKGDRNQNRFDEMDLTPPDWSTVQLSSFEKNFFDPTESLINRPLSDIHEYRHKNQIVVEGSDTPNPIQEFSDYNFHSKFFREFQKLEFVSPTPIQAQSWPIILSGQNLVAIAKTGSGKTLGFIFPAVMHILHQERVQRGEGPIVLVLAPTRELAQQILSVAETFGYLFGIRSACVYGGAPKGPQMRKLYGGVELIIATPGRMIDFLTYGCTNLNRCTYLVLDEADRMLDMGFEPQIRKIVNLIRPDRQTLMWSATWPRDVRKLAVEFLSDYVFLNIGSLQVSANHNIEQIVEVCQDNEKDEKLRHVIQEATSDPNSKVIVFAGMKKKTEMVSNMLKQNGIYSMSIHGDKAQRERDWVLNEFRSGRTQVLVATDVAARGLDVDNVNCVINYDFPMSIEDYVHRIGRTGRTDKSGTAYTFFTQFDKKHSSGLVSILEEANQNINPALLKLSYRNQPGSNRYRQARSYGRSFYGHGRGQY